MFKTITDLMTERFRAVPERKAILVVGENGVQLRVSYAELEAAIGRAANRFRELGIEKGDRVILYLPKSIELVIGHLAALLIGAVAVPLNPAFTRKEMEYYIGDSGARLILTGKDQEAVIDGIRSEVRRIVVDTKVVDQWMKSLEEYSGNLPANDPRPDDPAMIIYTSGTTGAPKGAVLSMQNIVHDATKIIAAWEIAADDVLAHALPLFHIHGLCFALHTSLLVGARVLLIDSFRPSQVLEILASGIDELSPTVFMAVPTMYRRLFDAIPDAETKFEHLRLITSGSAPLAVKDFRRIHEAFGAEPLEREGMSETGMNFSNPLNGRRVPGSIGLPLQDVKTRIVDPATLAQVPGGEVGELWLQGPGIMSGYWQKPEETKAAFVDGWFRTGDMVRVDEDGYYYITDRLKHIIIFGGENISPKEVEIVLDSHPAVRESCVVGLQDETWGEIVVAAVVLKDDKKATADEIQQHCRQHMLSWKCPKAIRFIDEIPRNTMGKVLKNKVKLQFQT